MIGSPGRLPANLCFSRALAAMAPFAHASVIRQAERLRLDGDGYFNKGRIGAAIDAYTEAIVLNPDVAASFVNRAECFRERKMWGRVEEDCRKAIDLDPNSFKGYYLLGLALLEKEELAKGIKELERAFDLRRAVHAEDRITKEIWESLCKAKFETWKLNSRKSLCDLEKLKQECEEALQKCCHLDKSDLVADGDFEETAKANKKQLELLSQVFNEAAQEHCQADVPDYLCCKISLQIFQDPVITPSGITYERSMILDHLRKVGQFDPTTKRRLEPHQLVPNLAVKDAVSAFLEKHGWAYEYHSTASCDSDQE